MTIQSDPSTILWGFPLLQHNPTSLLYLEQDVCIYNVTSGRIRLMFYLLCCPNILITFHPKTALLWRFNFADKNQPVKCPTFLSNFGQICNFSTDSHKSP